jgi:galactokinase/galacturonokinase
LRDVPDELFQRHLDRVDDAARRRAQHYRGEMRRVGAGVAAWTAGDLERFAAIVTETGHSSIRNYECGSPELIRLFEILIAQPGVLGARFAGAGFRGYCMALVSPDATEGVIAETRRAYLAAFPRHAERFHWHACRTADGASIGR